MSSPTQQPQSAIQPGQITWEYEIDLTQLSTSDQILEVSRLESGFCGKRVTIRVGTVDPAGLHIHPIVEPLARAKQAGVDLHLVGTPRAVRRWWDHIFANAAGPRSSSGPRLKAVQ
jgi:hypothetical protein